MAKRGGRRAPLCVCRGVGEGHRRRESRSFWLIPSFLEVIISADPPQVFLFRGKAAAILGILTRTRGRLSENTPRWAPFDRSSGSAPRHTHISSARRRLFDRPSCQDNSFRRHRTLGCERLTHVNEAPLSQNMTEPLAEVLLPNYRWLGRATHPQHTPVEERSDAKPSSKALRQTRGNRGDLWGEKINLVRQLLTRLVSEQSCNRDVTSSPSKNAPPKP